jgi:hypothetical protein
VENREGGRELRQSNGGINIVQVLSVHVKKCHNNTASYVQLIYTNKNYIEIPSLSIQNGYHQENKTKQNNKCRLAKMQENGTLKHSW